MLKITAALVGVLIIASSCGDKKEKVEAPVNVQVKSVGGMTIGYYVSDSIATGFDFYKSTQKRLADKKAKLDAKVSVHEKAYQTAGMALQNGMKMNTLSQNQVDAYQIKMRKSEEAIMQLQQTEFAKFEEEQYKANEVLMNKIDAYGQEFSEKNKIKLFLSKAKGGQITYVDGGFDMTEAFIDFMNKKEAEIEADIKD